MKPNDFFPPVPISVVLPVYNGEAYLRDCITSVLSQTHHEFEFLISDDGSHDASVGIIKSFRDPRIRLLPPEARRGLFGNLNRLVRESRGQIIHILCQDDHMETTCLMQALRFFTLHREVAMIFSKFHIVDREGKIIDTCALNDLPDILPPLLSLQHFFYHGCFPSNLSTVAVRKVCFEKAGLFDETFGVSADYEMWIRLCTRWDMGIQHKHLLRIRRHAKQLSRNRRSAIECIRENRRLRARLLPLLPPEIQDGARVFEKRRQSVLDVHHAVRSLFEGRIKDFTQIFHILGPYHFCQAMLAWLFTARRGFV